MCGSWQLWVLCVVVEKKHKQAKTYIQHLGVTDVSVHERETLTFLAFLRKSQDKQDAGNMPHEVNVSRTAFVVHLSLQNSKTVLLATCRKVVYNNSIQPELFYIGFHEVVELPMWNFWHYSQLWLVKIIILLKLSSVLLMVMLVYQWKLHSQQRCLI